MFTKATNIKTKLKSEIRQTRWLKKRIIFQSQEFKHFLFHCYNIYNTYENFCTYKFRCTQLIYVFVCSFFFILCISRWGLSNTFLNILNWNELSIEECRVPFRGGRHLSKCYLYDREMYLKPLSSHF